jgi:molybdopterin-guanine dinucleotide biosynthesis protein A
MLGRQSLLEHVLGRARPQVQEILISANGDPARFGTLGLPVLADTVPDFAGPLAGVLAGLEWLRSERPGIELLATFATDSPWFPVDLVERLRRERSRGGADLAVAASGGRVHPVFALWPVQLTDALGEALRREGLRRAETFLRRYRLAVVEWPSEPRDLFFNINTEMELDAAAALLAAQGSG